MEETWLEEFRQRAADGRCTIAVDIGANNGEWTAWMADHFDVVVAFEPDPRAFAELDRTKKKNIIAINAAVADAAGTAKLYLRESPLQTSLLEHHPIGAGGNETPATEVIEIPAVTLDSILETADGHVDFVKMDIEGAEAAVLGASKDKRWLRTRWLIEVHDTRQAVGEFLERTGFQNLRIQKHPYPTAHPEHFWVFAADGLDEEA